MKLEIELNNLIFFKPRIIHIIRTIRVKDLIFED